MKNTKEFHDLISQFQRDMDYQPGVSPMRFERERGDHLPKTIFFQDGRTNEMFLAYMAGYAFAKSTRD